jgi:hypothetical protein
VVGRSHPILPVHCLLQFKEAAQGCAIHGLADKRGEWRVVAIIHGVRVTLIKVGCDDRNDQATADCELLLQPRGRKTAEELMLPRWRCCQCST